MEKIALKKLPLPKAEPELMTTEKAAEFLEIQTRTLADKIRAGELPGYKAFGRLYVLKSELIEYVLKNKKEVS